MKIKNLTAKDLEEGLYGVFDSNDQITALVEWKNNVGEWFFSHFKTTTGAQTLGTFKEEFKDSTLIHTRNIAYIY